MKQTFISIDIDTQGVSGFLNTNSKSDFQNSKGRIKYGGYLMADQHGRKSILDFLGYDHEYGSFPGCWTRIHNHIFEVPIVESDMADHNNRKSINSIFLTVMMCTIISAHIITIKKGLVPKREFYVSF